MKNIHVIQTDKPSRLWINNLLQGKLELSKAVLIGSNTTQNIYITSDEEIKVGDWLIVNDEDIMQMKSSYDNDMKGEVIWVGNSLNGYETYKDNGKKIILTTDQDLINDGEIDPIDNEFLEWFVKNPSCEEVEVVKGFADGTAYGFNFLDYKIILPKEGTPEFVSMCENTFGGKIKQQTAVEFLIDWMKKNQYFIGNDLLQAVEKAKEIEKQQERMYSEEEVNLMFDTLKENSIGNVATITNVDLFISSWKRQFKKK